MPIVKMCAEFSCPVERVWRTVTDLEHWSWRSDIRGMWSNSGGRTFVELSRDRTHTYFQITAFAPRRWYALNMESEKLSGRWECYFSQAGAGTQVEFTMEAQFKRPMPGFRTAVCLRRRQKQYITDLRRALEVT